MACQHASIKKERGSRCEGVGAATSYKIKRYLSRKTPDFRDFDARASVRLSFFLYFSTRKKGAYLPIFFAESSENIGLAALILSVRKSSLREEKIRVS